MGVSEFFSKIPNLKHKNVLFCGGWRGRGNVFFTKDPNLKKLEVGGGGGGEWEASVSDFFY